MSNKRKKLNILNLVDIKKAKNGRAIFWCTCAECGIKKQDLLQIQVEKDDYLEKNSP